MKGVKKLRGAQQPLTPVSRSSRQQGEAETGTNGGVCVPSTGPAAAQLRGFPPRRNAGPGLSDCSQEDRTLYATEFGKQFSFSLCVTNCKEQSNYTSVVELAVCDIY